VSQQYLETATLLGLEASHVILELLKLPITKNKKKDQSWVTEADLKADDIIRNGLHQAFPDHAILTEEHGLIGSPQSEWIWLVDPLDGTKAYAQNKPGFSVMIGLLKEGSPYLGVVIDPLEGLIYQAMKGCGAVLIEGETKKTLTVSKRSKFSDMPLVFSTGFHPEQLVKITHELQGPVLDPINSVGIKVGLVVRQLADIYVNHHFVHYWDTCAPQIILEEAGGKFTRMDGEPLIYSMDGKFSHDSPTLASNGTRHEVLVHCLKKIF